ncbi:MAG: hypothetical protein P4L65_04110 [Legionella sp.]|nr:hypothetical protein [Legionella sp.]
MGFEEVKITDVKDNAKSILQKMQQPIDYIVYVDFAPILFSKRIPFLSRFINDVSKTGNAVLQLSNSINTFQHTTAPVALTRGLEFGGVALAALDFILIPVIYLASYILKQEVPISLTNNARWLFSGILLGLTLTAILAPVTASIIALVTAGIGFVLSGFLLSRVLYERYQLAKEHRALKIVLATAEDEMSTLKSAARLLENELSQTTDVTELAIIDSKIALLQGRYQTKKEFITELKGKKFEVDEKIKAVGFRHVLDKSIGILFSALAVSGLVVSLFFPPVGLAILTTVSIASIAYISIRIAVSLISSLVKFIQSKLQKTSEADVVAQDIEHREELKKEGSYSFMADHLPGHKEVDRPVTPSPARTVMEKPDELVQSRTRAHSTVSLYGFYSAPLLPLDEIGDVKSSLKDMTDPQTASATDKDKDTRVNMKVEREPR